MSESGKSDSTIDEVADAICQALASWIAEPLHRMAYMDAARAATQVMKTDQPHQAVWKTFAEKPLRPMMVEYYHGNWPLFEAMPPYRDERRAIGFFDGKRFCELGTGHDMFESWKQQEDYPTHWRQAAESPK